MKHIYLNLKRFDVPAELGGVNRGTSMAAWGAGIVSQTQQGLKRYDADEVEFVQYYPETHLLRAIEAREAQSPVRVG